jgi:hypothetical protein
MVPERLMQNGTKRAAAKPILVSNGRLSFHCSPQKASFFHDLKG